MTDTGIKSKERVAQFGEVYTPENIVNDMLDLAKDESYRIDSKFLEPAAGNGNFLVKILERKLKTACEWDLDNYDRNVFITVSSLYAIDILKDNIAEAKERMKDIIIKSYIDTTGKEISAELLKVLAFVIDANIIWGDSLTGFTTDKADSRKDIVFSEWNIIEDTVNRKDYLFNNMGICVDEYEPIDFRHIYNIKKKKQKNELFDEFPEW